VTRAWRASLPIAIDAIVPGHGATAASSRDALALPVLDYEFDGVAEFDAAWRLARDFRTRSPRLPGGEPGPAVLAGAALPARVRARTDIPSGRSTSPGGSRA
jgi:hypothetical protein